AIGMDHLRVLRAQLSSGRAPLFGRRLNEEPAGPRSDLTQLIEAIADARAAARALRAVARHELRRCTALGDPVIELLDGDGGPGDIELLGDQHRQRGPHALPDLAAARADHDAAIGLDAHERSERLADGGWERHVHRLIGDAASRPGERYCESPS